MCNKRIGSGQDVDSEEKNRAGLAMDSPSAPLSPRAGSTAVSTPGSNDETNRVKFLCSFSGNIFPRPQDGKLRYVGGETRIVSVPRDIKYDDLMGRMREIFDGANLLKYQQPDEDLDALVSVVNDDDVTNMMEEYDKLGSGDGFTRLRIFLFSHADQDVPIQFVEADDRDNERRYVDALNNMNEGLDIRSHQWSDSPRMSFVDDMYSGEQLFGTGTEGSVHSQRNWDIAVPSFNLQHTQYGSCQVQHMAGQRYNDMEPPRHHAPAFYSPRHQGHFDPRSSELPQSPSSATFHIPIEFPDNRYPEEYGRPPQVIQQPPPNLQQPQPILQQPHPMSQPTLLEPQPENAPWIHARTPSSENAGFPGNLLHGNSNYEGNNIRGQYRMTYIRNQPAFEHSHLGNGLQQVVDPGMEYPPDAENGWIPRNQLNPRAEGLRGPLPAAVSSGDHYVVDGTGMAVPAGQRNHPEGPLMASNYSQLEEPRYARTGYEFGGEPFVNKVVAPGLRMQSPALEVPYDNPQFIYRTENSYQVQHGYVPAPGSWRNVQPPSRHGYEMAATPLPNGTVNPEYYRNTRESSPVQTRMDNQNVILHTSPETGLDASAMLEYPHGHALRLNTRTINQVPVKPSHIQSVPDNLASSGGTVNVLTAASVPVNSQVIVHNPEPVKDISHVSLVEVQENGTEGTEETPATEYIDHVQQHETGEEKQDGRTVAEAVCTHLLELLEETQDVEILGEKDPSILLGAKLSVEQLSFLPELIASVKKAALDGAEEVKARVQQHSGSASLDKSPVKETIPADTENTDPHVDVDSDSENVDASIIEPTKAEAEAVERGLQTIRNADLEEIRELGSGTYGAVYHGKWKGSDVAVKRIKSSCFAGKPSDRERLIADFWKEALLLSSLHHPNVVSFYGIVRDGPDGSLATVTEFMTNGSLKQFLQKKDRTIDRRKRLIIAMDAAFGMEYLHGKNIVHFDLKCENLLVNMKDPQRPVCKIGDLGLSKVKQHTLVSGGVRGTLPWMAPELLSGKSNMVSENVRPLLVAPECEVVYIPSILEVDVYSFGIVMWELLTGEEPYKEMHCASIIGGIVNNTLRPQIPSWCDPEWRALMESCWAANPADRPSFTEISQKLRNMAAAMNLK